MKSRVLVLLAFLPFPIFSQIANQATLTLVKEDGANEVDIEVTITLNAIELESDDSSDLSGTIDVALNILPGTATTDEFTIISADVQGSDIKLSAQERILFAVIAEYEFTGTGLGFTAETIDAPGPVTAETGEFDASDHAVTVDRGLLNGSANSLVTEEIAVMFDFAEAPFTGAGSGTGTVTVNPGRREGIRQYYDISVELPISLVQEIELEDVEIEGLAVNGDISGTIKAVGETFLDIPDYNSWADEAGIDPESQDEFNLSPSIPNYALFALGHDGASVPGQLFTVSSEGITLDTSGDFALGDLAIEWSEDLENWSLVPQTAMTSGNSSIAFGDSFEMATTIGLEGVKKYVRVAQAQVN
ncbi:MAG: hypothetical protein ABF379_14105 [Akkermansiaceae bacterium]